ncbi:MAG: uracil-DNA glycosylase [Kangiellaceae bacterium]|nr:uracil-DNA glycosylase [Kangiellaceae bacterium]
MESTDLAINSWQQTLESVQQQPYFKQVIAFVAQQRAEGKTIYPPQDRVFAALQATEFNQVKVVIIGQDPYHGPNQANGLCFSVNAQVPLPPSLRNIYKEIENDLNCSMSNNGDLSRWAAQGVLLLNTILTVEQAKAHSHKGKGWEQLTDAIIRSLNESPQHIVFLLWGAHAQCKSDLINSKKHTILTAPHPSPLSAHRGFFGCNHFSKTNQILEKHKQTPIQWQL